jgi:protein TonB
VALPPPTLAHATAGGERLGRGVLLALGLHAAVVIVALGVWRRHVPAKPPEGRAIAVTLEMAAPGVRSAPGVAAPVRQPETARVAAGAAAVAAPSLPKAVDGVLPPAPTVTARRARQGTKGELVKPAPVAVAAGGAPAGGASARPAPLGVTRPAKADKETTVFYSMLSRRTDQQGVVTLSVPVAADGTAGPVAVAQSSGFADLDNVARSAVQGWHFQPALKNGVPVASVLTYKFRFELN